jgi:hypothetical protein
MDETSKSYLPEPWLRGTHADLPAVVRAVIHALELADDDVGKAWGLLREDELNARPFDLSPVAFHMRHIVRSLDRLLTYAEGKSLDEWQRAALRSELAPRANKAELLSEFSEGLKAAKARVIAFSQADLSEKRAVGVKQLPTSVGGLLVHVADHTQRHVGQVVTTSKLILAMRNK